ncbi:DEAD-box ATP-dependent RNA helicase 21 [Tanacetum coccineum]
MDAPFKSCHLAWNQVSIDGVIYWRAYDHIELINGSLALLDYNDEDETGLWMRKDGENKPFTKMYTVKAEGSEETELDVYEPSSGRINSVGIVGKHATLSVRSFPTVRGSVGIVIRNALYTREVVGFGVCPRTSDHKGIHKAPPRIVSIDGVIYWRAYDDVELDDEFRSNFIISFDLKNDKFGEVCLPERLVYTHHLLVANVNESLVLLEYNDEGEMCLWCVDEERRLE